MMEIQKFLAFFLTLYTVKTNCDMLNKKAICQTMIFIKFICSIIDTRNQGGHFHEEKGSDLFQFGCIDIS